MKKILFFASITFLMLCSCRKESTTSEAFTTSAEATTSLEDHSQEITRSLTNNSVNAVRFNFDTTVHMPEGISRFNDCTREYIRFSGSYHYRVQGVIKGDKTVTYIEHYDVQNVKGVGETTGTRYVTTEAFNFSSTSNFTTETVVNDLHYVLHYITLGKETNFSLRYTSHLTINANGDVTVSIETGDIITCQK